MSKQHFLICEECGDEIGRYIPCEKAFISNGKTLCRDCFMEEAAQLVQNDPEWFAELCGVVVKEVE